MKIQGFNKFVNCVHILNTLKQIKGSKGGGGTVQYVNLSNFTEVKYLAELKE